LPLYGKYNQVFEVSKFFPLQVGRQKNGSFGFLAWLVCRKKPNVPFAGRLFTMRHNVPAMRSAGFQGTYLSV